MSSKLATVSVLCFLQSVPLIGCSSDAASGDVAVGGASGQSASGGSSGANALGGSGGQLTAAGSSGTTAMGNAGGSGGMAGAGGMGGSGGATVNTGGSGGEAAGSGGNGGGGGAPALVGCAGKDYQLCEDFEGVAPGEEGSIWTVRDGFPTEVVTDEVNSGAKAIRVKANGQGYGGIQENMILPEKDYWLRVYILLDSEDNGGHEGMVVMNGNPESFRLYNNTGGGDVMLDRTSQEFGFEISQTTKLPRNEWNCWEWHETPTEIHTYIDGVEVEDVIAQWPEPEITSIMFGFERYHDGGEGYIYYDDIALDNKRIGCD